MESGTKSASKLDKFSKVIEIINKIFVGIVLFAITSILTWRSNFISDSIKQGEFEVKKMEYEQKLLEDFMFNDTSDAKYMRQDVALAILYDFLKRDTTRNKFVLDIARIVALDTSRMKNSMSNMPLVIINRIDGGKGREVQYDYSKLQESYKSKRQFIAVLKEKMKRGKLKYADTSGFANFKKINRFAGKETVFIQIIDDSLNDKAEIIRQKLLDNNYLVPTIQTVKYDSVYGNSVRYFNSQDYTTAKEIIDILVKHDNRSLIPLVNPDSIKISDWTKYKELKAPIGYVELWLSSLNNEILKRRKRWRPVWYR